MGFKLDLKMKEYANEAQWTKLKALAEYGSFRKAGNALGCHHASVQRALKAVNKKAGQHGYAPTYDLTHRTAPGMRSKGTSIRYDEDGNVQQYWNKTAIEGRDPEEAVQLPDPKTIVKLSTCYDQEGRVSQQWVAEKPEAVAQAAAWQEYAKALAEDLPRVDPTPAPKSKGSDLMTCYPVGDHHMGMLAWNKETAGGDYDIKIGENLLVRATDHLVEAAPESDAGLVVFLGDFMHYDSMEPVTPTSRNQLDADGRFPKMVRASIRAMRYLIEKAATKHKTVHVIVEIGNHDLSSSIFLMEALHNIYDREPRITIDTSPRHFHYYQFGACLIGVHHGHGTNMKNLPLTMAADMPEAWGQTMYRMWWTGHIHKSVTQAATSAQDYSGCTVESFRVLAAADAWADQKGYRPHRDMKSIILHKEFGEVSRQIVNPAMFE